MNNVIGFPIILISWIVIYTVDGIIQCSNNAGPEPGGGKRRGLGLRNDVLITCKAFITTVYSDNISLCFKFVMISQHLELKVEIQNDVINKSQLLPTLYYEMI